MRGIGLLVRWINMENKYSVVDDDDECGGSDDGGI